MSEFTEITNKETPVPVPAQLPANTPAKTVAKIANNIVVIMGIAVLVVIIGSLLLSWFDKTVPEAVLTMGGVALGYLGNVIVGSGSNGQAT